MAETQKSETSRSSSRKPAAKDDLDPVFPVNFAEASLRGISLLAQGNSILLQTAREIWDKEADLLQPAHFFAPQAPNGSGMRSFLEQWHDNAERTLGQMRDIQDLMRECEWRLLTLAADNMAVPAQRAAE